MKTIDERAERTAKAERRARAVLVQDRGWWKMRILDRHGLTVNEDSLGVGTVGMGVHSWHRMLDAANEAVGAVRTVEAMGHVLQEWDWLVDQVKS